MADLAREAASVVVSRVREYLQSERWMLNEYACLASLGKGSYGEVVLAEDTRKGELVVSVLDSSFD